MLEVEQKFRVPDLAAIAARLTDLGGTLGEAELQIDRYFNHPSREFARTDEALRIRQVGEMNYVTYKGPKLDSTTKTRREIEVPIAPGDVMAEQFAELLVALGFRPVAEVRKQRRKTTLEHRGWRIELVLDEVERVGQYVELEVVVEPSEMDAAREAIGSLAAELGLTENERKSYLELLLERR
ncbi:MAG: class IV adenylate cyclase [Pirellulales bacterium]